MAFRDDTDALHARIDALEKELAEARGELDRLRDVEAERDRLRARVEALEPKPKPRRAPERPAFETSTPRPATGGPGPRLLLGALVLLLVAGLAGWLLFEQQSATSDGPKPPDTRPPTIGVVDLGATPAPVPIPFTVTGTIEAPSGCVGYLPEAPQLVLRASTPTMVSISTSCDDDLVAVLTGASEGTVCNDDGGEGTNPRLDAIVPAGESRLAIGTYSEGASASCAIELHASPLPSGVDATGLAVDATPRVHTTDASGVVEEGADGTVEGVLVPASRADAACVGAIPSVPDLVVDVREPSILRVDVVAYADLVLVMRAPDGTYTCDDDDGPGNAPRIAKRVPPGRYAIWVGLYAADAAADAVPYHATTRVTPLSAEALVVVPSIDVADGAPTTLSGMAGDEVSAASMWSECPEAGFVPYEPQATLRLAARRDVVIGGSVRQPLFVVAPHDHASRVRPSCGVDPTWRGTLDAGSYDLYVGVASAEEPAAPFTLSITSTPPSVLPYSPSPSAHSE